MKSMRKILAFFMMAATISMVSCKSDDEEKPEPPARDLTGTAWECEMNGTYTQQGITMNIGFLSMIDFIDNQNGEQFYNIDVTVPQYPSANQSFDMTEVFTYTMTGNALTLVATGSDPETGEPYTTEYKATYNADDNTIVFDYDDDQMAEILGSDVVVYHEIPVNSNK